MDKSTEGEGKEGAGLGSRRGLCGKSEGIPWGMVDNGFSGTLDSPSKSVTNGHN